MSPRIPSSIPSGDSAESEDHFGEERRLSGRLQCPYLECYLGYRKLGEVVDLSSSGLRVFRKGGRSPFKLGMELNLRLAWHEDSVDIVGRLVRIERIGWRKHDLGIAFVNLSQEASDAITSLARGARFQLKFMTDRDVA